MQGVRENENPKTMNSYGVTEIDAEKDPFVEEVRRLGYTVLPEVVPADVCEEARRRLDAVYEKQVHQFGATSLAAIKETDLARCPLSYDSWFLRFLDLPAVTGLVSRLVGEFNILNLQNGIINRPAIKHHQVSWHRDLPYQNWVCSRPLAVNALFCIDDFSIETGGTYVLPHSHQFETFPSGNFVEQHECPVTAGAGSVIIFDAMLFHRAGANTSQRIRRGLNHLYTIPLLKQQICIPEALRLAGINPPENLRRVLGCESTEPASVEDWRQRRLDRAHS